MKNWWLALAIVSGVIGFAIICVTYPIALLIIAFFVIFFVIAILTKLALDAYERKYL